jgi:uncharacterized membrane protein YdjX (TVP38/TMEM64 family)
VWKFIRKNGLFLFLLIIIIAAPIVFKLYSSVIADNYNIFLANKSSLNTDLSHHIGLLFVVYGILIFTMSIGITPTTLVAIASGYLLGWNGLIPVVISYMASTFVGFRIGKWGDKGNIIENIKSDKIKNLLGNIHQREWQAIILIRLSPIVPFAVGNFVFAALRINIVKLLLIGFVGMLPRTILSMWIGTKTSSLLNSSPDSSVKIILAALVVFTVYGFWKLFIKKESVSK